MDQLMPDTKSTATRLKASRLANGYSLEDLAIATGLTVSEIAAAEGGLTSAPASHVARISHALT
jgi:transcriptional regulator with XRE-family HTH domain